MHVQHGTEAATHTTNLLERVAANTVTVSAREARLRLQTLRADRGVSAPHPEPARPAPSGQGGGHVRLRPFGAEPAVPRTRSPQPHQLAPKSPTGRGNPGQPDAFPDGIGELRRALDSARADVGRLRAALAEARTDLDTVRQEAARAAGQNDELRQDLGSAETERQQALFFAEQAEAARAASERARTDADYRSAQMSVHAEQAEQAAQAALAWAHRTQIARDAAFADAARCQQEATGLASRVEELHGLLAAVSAERDAARAEAARARGLVDQWTSRALVALATPSQHDSRGPADPDHHRQPTDGPVQPSFFGAPMDSLDPHLPAT
ncbi:MULTISPECIES: hypothetical protein [unclassified Kitasatospora]|uniref:hypothetical protein n=1 Tax=unclassified Kitasatospora TaxID=2633591 RepID=UPI00340E76C7